jgi:hypothetical protein
MAKKHNIRWTNKDNENLRKSVKNFNAKVERAIKKNPDLINYLPKKLSVKELRNEIQTRADLNRKLNSVKKFAKKDAEKLVTTETGFKITKYELNEYKNNVRILNITNAIKRKDLGLSAEKGTSRQVKELNIDKRKPKVGTSLDEFRIISDSIAKKLDSKLKQKQLSDYRKNYIKAIEESGINSDQIKNMIKNLSDEKLFQLTSSNPKLIIDFYYDTNFSPEELEESILEEFEISLS